MYSLGGNVKYVSKSQGMHPSLFSLTQMVHGTVLQSGWMVPQRRKRVLGSNFHWSPSVATDFLPLILLQLLVACHFRKGLGAEAKHFI